MESRQLRAGTCLVRFKTKEHTNEPIHSMIQCERDFVAVELVDFKLWITRIGIEGGVYLSFAKWLHAFVPLKGWMGIFYGNSVQYLITVTELERSAFLWAKHNRRSSFRLLQFYRVYSKHRFDFPLFKFSWLQRCTVGCRIHGLDILRGDLHAIFGYSDSAMPSIVFVLKFFWISEISCRCPS